MPRSVLVQTDRTIDPLAWSVGHLRGDRPGRMPYGLDELRVLGLATRHLSRDPRALTDVIGRAARLAGHRWEWLNAARAVRARPDLHLCWDEKSGIPTAIGSARSGVPTAMGIIWLTERTVSGREARLARHALARAEVVWALSSAQLPVLRDELGVPPRRLRRLPFGIDADFWSPDRVSADDAASGVAGDVATVLGLGNDQDRDHAALVRAVAPVTRGDGRRLRLVTSQAIDVPADAGSVVPLMGHRALRREYARAAVVCVALRPNLHVSGMTTLLEAQAMGRPVVATSTPGMTDYVVDGVTGVLVPPGDDQAMRAAVDGLLRDPQRRSEMGRAGRAFVARSASARSQAVALAEILAGQ